MCATMQKFRMRDWDMRGNITSYVPVPMSSPAPVSGLSGPPRPPASAIAGLLVVVTLWGLNFSVSKWALGQFPPLAFTAIRFSLAALLLALVLRHFEGPLTLPPGALRRLTVLGLIGNTGYQLAFISGLARTTATNSALVLASMPVMVAALGAATRTERLAPRARLALGTAFLGVVIVIVHQGVKFSAATLDGDLLSLAAVLCWAVFTLGVRRLHTPLSPLAITAWTLMLGTPMLVLAGIPQLVTMDWSRVTPLGWAGLVYSSALSLVVAYILWNRSVRLAGTNRTAIFACLTPVIAMITAAAILGERPGVVQVLGGALVVGGVGMMAGGRQVEGKR
jgi:drug/metabolite transporter (DMT)-like permease